MTTARPEKPARAPVIELVRKYNRPGPRYTSYPTAPQFHDGVDAEAYGRALGASNATEGDLSLYVHLPFCRSLCHYCGCHMMVTHRPEKIARYVRYVKREADLLAARLAPGRRVVQMHWGGGTPTLLRPEEITGLATHLRRRFAFAAGAEVSLEADPRGLTEKHLSAARRAGFNRVSFGVQDFDADVQAAIGRVQPQALVEKATGWARALGFSGVNFDLIYGLPHQTVERFRRTLDAVLALAPDRLSLFGYAHVPWMKKHQRLIQTAWLPTPALRLRIFLMALERLTDQGGYRHIGMDHFARPGDPLCAAQDDGTLGRNFQGYTTHAGATLLGLGVSSIGQLPGLYVQNEKGLPPYYAALDAGRLPVARGVALGADDRLRRYVIMQLMCRFALDIRAVEKAFGICFADYFADALRDLALLEADGLVEVTPERIRVPPAGRLLVRNVVLPFDRYLRGQPARPSSPPVSSASASSPLSARRPAYSNTI